MKDILLASAFRAHQTGNFAEAERLLGEAIRIDPAPETIYNRGCVLQNLRRDEEALRCFQRAIALKPDFLDALVNCGISQLALRRYADALESFDKVLAKMEPRLAYKVDNKLSDDDTKIGVELRFSNMEDFEPQNLVEQVEPLRKLIELRRKLANLRSSLYGNDKLEKMLQQILNDDQELNKLRAEVGLPEPDAGSGKGI
jgi:tetratricopeptide (TPR) repeat protein